MHFKYGETLRVRPVKCAPFCPSCADSMWHPLTQGKNPPDMKPLFSVNSCSAQRARFMLGSLEASNMRLGCLVTDSLGALCPWFDSWEPGSVLTCESRVSVRHFMMSNPP